MMQYYEGLARQVFEEVVSVTSTVKSITSKDKPFSAVWLYNDSDVPIYIKFTSSNTPPTISATVGEYDEILSASTGPYRFVGLSSSINIWVKHVSIGNKSLRIKRWI